MNGTLITIGIIFGLLWLGCTIAEKILIKKGKIKVKKNDRNNRNNDTGTSASAIRYDNTK